MVLYMAEVIDEAACVECQKQKLNVQDSHKGRMFMIAFFPQWEMVLSIVAKTSPSKGDFSTETATRKVEKRC